MRVHQGLPVPDSCISKTYSGLLRMDQRPSLKGTVYVLQRSACVTACTGGAIPIPCPSVVVVGFCRVNNNELQSPFQTLALMHLWVTNSVFGITP